MQKPGWLVCFWGRGEGCQESEWWRVHRREGTKEIRLLSHFQPPPTQFPARCHFAEMVSSRIRRHQVLGEQDLYLAVTALCPTHSGKSSQPHERWSTGWKTKWFLVDSLLGQCPPPLGSWKSPEDRNQSLPWSFYTDFCKARQRQCLEEKDPLSLGVNKGLGGYQLATFFPHNEKSLEFCLYWWQEIFEQWRDNP